ncbi:MAG: hypothetical protein A3H59_02195 [Candidatus Jacksonbacteria bacterium RIFCSPLOWO2_02_FULL_43_9]|nr:MAG: hypothetical protein UV70_C0001G0069 [Parcubacteria group bacterium GW2011_GWA2_43_13]OGY69274.1 MAG: hypothetical protein A3B94_02055 [Candidatus Jacksonbacteria bacterium RIFCSPHIGHO2_02_FULL_43_10]OGY71619.1 MAG: hypothetical protein A2986_01785 [Candidatus Jacksonbacteria bacterium RIFCSPLOWO2_01_FULL_44_13]OGY74416.1 MAG: hypothetical protein A3H59_02195 [Candidatus Jacksonbacteria bacterium RIFCSPLOWO2_02_FULL_43_9]HAZ16618.1 hypothetical protein [Candidatus Jacksonbacteria bacter
MLLNQKYSSGFTLMELIVTMAIMVLLFGAVLANVRFGNTQKKPHLAGLELVSQLEKMRNFSQTGKLFGSVVPQGGWGVAFEFGAVSNNSYSLFADVNNDGLFQASERFGTVLYLPEKVYVKAVAPATLTFQPLTIVYRPPYGDFIVNQNPASSDIFITLSTSGNEAQKILTLKRNTGAPVL